jgi:hypothetical protein
MPTITWHVSSFCNSSTCVEVGRDGDRVLVQRSAEPERTLEFSLDEWRAFLTGARAGEFDF